MLRLRASGHVAKAEPFDDEAVEATLLQQQGDDATVGAGILADDLDAAELLARRQRQGLTPQRRANQK